ncbi:MAG TPA: nickel transporter permease [Thermoleophilia bacterium]|nr:nickel transporter permease [Thermoleophilia bacterium]
MESSVATSGRLADWRVRHRASLDEARYNVRVFLKDKLAVLGLVIIIGTITMAVFAPWIAPYPQQGQGESNLKERFEAPSAKHLMGTDNLGRDILSRVVYGARIPLVISFTVTAVIVLIGVPLGGIAGYYGGRIDEVVMRVTDVFLAFPSLVLAITFVAFLGPSIRNVMIAIVVSWWPWYTRLVRGVAVSLRERPYVEAARTMGVRDSVIIFRHILPNAFGPVIVQMTLDIGTVILAAAALSFVGLGAQPPTPEWGLMISEGRQYILDYWWIGAFAGLAIFILVLAFNFVGDGLRDVLDPRSKR